MNLRVIECLHFTKVFSLVWIQPLHEFIFTKYIQSFFSMNLRDIETHLTILFSSVWIQPLCEFDIFYKIYNHSFL